MSTLKYIQKNVLVNTEHKPSPLKIGIIRHTLSAPHFEYCEIVNSRKNRGTPKKKSMNKKAITNAP